jgi:hypothetical protein
VIRKSNHAYRTRAHPSSSSTRHSRGQVSPKFRLPLFPPQRRRCPSFARRHSHSRSTTFSTLPTRPFHSAFGSTHVTTSRVLTRRSLLSTAGRTACPSWTRVSQTSWDERPAESEWCLSTGITVRFLSAFACIIDRNGIVSGKSVNVQNLSTDALRCAPSASKPRGNHVRIWFCCAADADSCYRWLNNEQALEDSANFMRNVKFKGIGEDLTAPNTPWIYYGVRMPCR